MNEEYKKINTALYMCYKRNGNLMLIEDLYEDENFQNSSGLFILKEKGKASQPFEPYILIFLKGAESFVKLKTARFPKAGITYPPTTFAFSEIAYEAFIEGVGTFFFWVISSNKKYAGNNALLKSDNMVWYELVPFSTLKLEEAFNLYNFVFLGNSTPEYYGGAE